MLDAYRQVVIAGRANGDCMSNQIQPRLEAVIEIGATGIRLLVAEISATDEWVVIDRAERALEIGRAHV